MKIVEHKINSKSYYSVYTPKGYLALRTSNKHIAERYAINPKNPIPSTSIGPAVNTQV